MQSSSLSTNSQNQYWFIINISSKSNGPPPCSPYPAPCWLCFAFVVWPICPGSFSRLTSKCLTSRPRSWFGSISHDFKQRVISALCSLASPSCWKRGFSFVRYVRTENRHNYRRSVACSPASRAAPQSLYQFLPSGCRSLPKSTTARDDHCSSPRSFRSCSTDTRAPLSYRFRRPWWSSCRCETCSIGDRTYVSSHVTQTGWT